MGMLKRTFKLLSILTALAAAAFGQQITVYSSGSIAIGDSRQLTAYVPLVAQYGHLVGERGDGRECHLRDRFDHRTLPGAHGGADAATR